MVRKKDVELIFDFNFKQSQNGNYDGGSVRIETQFNNKFPEMLPLNNFFFRAFLTIRQKIFQNIYDPIYKLASFVSMFIITIRGKKIDSKFCAN